MDIKLSFPVDDSDIASLDVGDTVHIYGKIFCGRDAVLPKLAAMYERGELDSISVDLTGSAIFHTAVSRAGVGPTSSSKPEIENNIPSLSAAGVKLHLGKGRLKKETVEALERFNSVYAVIPPVTALLTSRIKSSRVAAFEEEGMEALYELEVEDYPAVIAAAKGRSLYE